MSADRHVLRSASPVPEASGLRLVVHQRPRWLLQLALLLSIVLVAWGTSRSGLPVGVKIVALAALAAGVAACRWSRIQHRREFLISDRGIDERRRRIDWLPRRIEDEIHLPGDAIARLYLRHSRSGLRWHIGQPEPVEESAKPRRRSWYVEVEARGQRIEIAGGLDFVKARSLLLDISRSLAGAPKEIALSRAIPARDVSRSNDTSKPGELR